MKIIIKSWENKITNKETGEVLIEMGHGGFYESYAFAMDFLVILKTVLTPSQFYNYDNSECVVNVSNKKYNELLKIKHNYEKKKADRLGY